MTNYRKNGSTFENLLVLIPVRDSTSVLRFCVGLQCECDSQASRSIANATAAEKERAQEGFIHWASLLLESFPDTMPVQHSRPKGPVVKAPDNGKLNDRHLREALAGALLSLKNFA